LFHTSPGVPHYASKFYKYIFLKSESLFNKIKIFNVTENKAVGVMKPGHTFTIEPMISQGKLVTK